MKRNEITKPLINATERSEGGHAQKSTLVSKEESNKRNAENRMQKEQKLDVQHPKQDIKVQFLCVRAQRAQFV